MGKYLPLRRYLASQEKDRVPMSFEEIERLIGLTLPASKKYPAWWSNNPSNNPMTKEWLAAGFETQDVDVASESVVFCRAARDEKFGFGETPQTEFATPNMRHPLFGRLKGVITLAPGVDLTDPPDPDLADYLDRKYGPEAKDD